MPPRPEASERFALEIAGATAGFLTDVTGLALEADIALIRDGGSPFAGKSVTAWRWTPTRAAFGLSMGKPMADWIQASFDQGGSTRDGVLSVLDANGKAQSRYVFSQALITEVTIPKLDGQSRDPGRIDVTWAASRVQWTKGGGASVGTVSPKPKAWLTANFRIEIGNLPCKRVATIDAFTWRCEAVTMRSGDGSPDVLLPGKVTVPDLKLSIGDADLPAWADAARTWFIDGKHGDGEELNGRIVFLSTDLQTELGQISLGKVGFKRFAERDTTETSGQLGRFNVELYVETMAFKPAG